MKTSSSMVTSLQKLHLMTVFEECEAFLENLPKGLPDDEKEILPPVVMLWSALKKFGKIDAKAPKDNKRI